MTATPRPWKVKGSSIIAQLGGEEVQVALMSRTNYCGTLTKHEALVRDMLKAAEGPDAALIVKAVNTLDEAKAAIKAVLNEYDKATMFDANGSKFDMLKAVLAKLEAAS